MSEHISEFSERIKVLMEEKHIRQTDISKRTGISEGTVSKYVSGQQTPKSDKIDLIARAYGVNPAWLLGYDVPMSADAPRIGYARSSGAIDWEKSVNSSDRQLQRLLMYSSKLLTLRDADRKIVEDMIERLSGGDANGEKEV